MRKLVLLIWLLSFTITTNSQTYPQYEFYSNYDISTLTGGVKNCVDEAESIEYALKLYEIIKEDSLSEGEKFMAQLYAGLICHNNKGKIESISDLESVLVKVAYMNDRQRIDLLARLYEIEKNCYIKYMTTDGDGLNFQSDSKDDEYKITVDFGSHLVSDIKDSVDLHCLKFANPVTQIDANIFSENVCSIVLPISKNLRYLNNARKDVSNLKQIEGYDVKNNLLIDSSGTLIVGAIAGLSEFSVPECIKILGEDCLRNSKLERIVIPQSVSLIKTGAFDKCSVLKDVILKCERVVDLEENVFFEDIINILNIYVPKKTLKQYQKKYPLLKKRFIALK